MTGRQLTIHCSGPVEAALSRTPSTRLAPGDVHAWFAPLPELAPRELAAMEPVLDPHERERAARFRFEKDRLRYVVGHVWLRRILSEYLGTSPETLEFGRGSHGKPFVIDHDLHFNFSDTKDGILVAISGDLELGADVETMHRTVDHHAVSEHYFTTEETADIRRAADQKRRFLELWTRKEAVLKASGVGIMEDLKVLRVEGQQQTLTVRHPEFLRMAHPIYHVTTWTLGPDHIVSLAAPAPTTAAQFFELPY